MPRTRIKVCGIKTVGDALVAAEAGADAIGLMFVRSSPRFIEPADGFAIMASLPPMVAAVGVLADASVDDFLAIEEVCPTPLTQLHGSESSETVRRCGPDVVKAIRFNPDTIANDLAHWGSVEEVCAILVDGSAGGAGDAFEWERLAEHSAGATKPLIVAGGLNPDNVGRAIGVIRPFAVDVSSGVESERGVKDQGLIRAFCQAVQAADA